MTRDDSSLRSAMGIAEFGASAQVREPNRHTLAVTCDVRAIAVYLCEPLRFRLAIRWPPLILSADLMVDGSAQPHESARASMPSLSGEYVDFGACIKAYHQLGC